jgi:hypothetical protein
MSDGQHVRAEAQETDAEGSGAELCPLVEQHTVRRKRGTRSAVPVIGDLIGMSEGAPLVRYPGQPGTAALRAQSVIEVHGAHVGRRVVLFFEQGDAARPIVMGLLREGNGRPLPDQAGNVDVDSDGAQLIVSAKEQLVLRCGKASITLTRAGKVLIEGCYLSSRSSGVNRIKGGSVQLN